jgi:L-aminoadipate-semialdehyde dehydrogenase
LHNLEDIADEGIEMGATTVFLKRFRPLQAEVRDHLKGRLPIQAVPTTYIVLNKLPLNPNGKVDKPRLPFPDIAEATEEASDEDLKRWDALSETERSVATIWAKLIPGLNEKTIAPDAGFFDLGGHSLLAQQMLLQMRRQLKASVPIATLYEHNTLRTFSTQVDHILHPTNGVTNRGNSDESESSYAKSLGDLLKQLPATYQIADPSTIRARSKPTVFLTGATGFLGAYIIKDVCRKMTAFAYSLGSQKLLEELQLA